MKSNVYFYIVLRIFFLFGLGMASTFIPEHLREFFGDTKFIPYKTTYGLIKKSGEIDTEWVWGARHYWFFWMMFFLFVLSLIDTVVSIYNVVFKNYPNLNNHGSI